MPIDPGSLAGNIAGLGQQVFGGITNQNALQWYQNALMNALNNLQGAAATGTQAANPISLYLQQLLSGSSGPINEYLNSPDGGFNWQLGDQLQGGQQRLQDLFLGGRAPNIPGYEDQLNNMSGLSGGVNNLIAALSGAVQNGGRTNENMALYDRFSDIGTGRNIGVDSLKDIGTRLLNSGGVNALTQGYQDRGLGMLNSGGYDALLNGAAGSAQGIIGQGGTTATNAIAQLLGAKGVQKEGTNEATDFLTSRGAEILGGDPLMSMQEAVSIARNEAATKNNQMGESARRQILQRGGGPGATLGSGRLGNDLLEFEDMKLQNEADAVGKARQQQQALQLALFGQGGDLVNSGQAIASQRLGTFGDILRGGEGIATQRLLSALGMLPEIADSATGKAGTYGQLGLQGGQLELSRLLGGGDLTQNYIQSLLSGLSGANNVQQGQNQLLLGAGGLTNNALGTNAGIFDSLLGNMLGGGQFNLQQAGAYTGAKNQNLGQQIDYSGMLGGQGTNAANGLNDLTRAWLSYAQTGVGGQAGVFGNYSGGNPWGGLAGMSTSGFFK